MEELHEIWKELYQIALEIRDLAPWELLWSKDKIAILLPDREHPVYCSVLGKGGSCYGICVYHTLRGIYGAKWLEENEVPPLQQSRYQECLIYYLGNREQLSVRDRRILNDLGLKFRGKNAWPYFRALEAGCPPTELNREQAELMITTLRNLFMAVRALKEGRTGCCFDEGEVLYRSFDQQQECWKTYAKQAPLPEIHYPQMLITDELLLERLRRTEFTEDVLELDIASLAISVKEKGRAKTCFARCCMIADHETGRLEWSERVLCDNQAQDFLIDGFVAWVEQYGVRPEEIIVRDEEMYVMLAGICSQLEISICIDPCLEAIDRLVERGLYCSEE